jgi:hypothetical protein
VGLNDPCLSQAFLHLGGVEEAVDQIGNVVEVRAVADRRQQAQPADAERFTLKQADQGYGVDRSHGLRTAGGGAMSNLVEERGARLQRGILTMSSARGD